MTVLHLITRMSLGGTTSDMIDSALVTSRAGCRTILATGPAGSEISTVEAAQARGCRVELIPELQREVSPVKDLLALRRIVGLLRRERVALLHTHTSKAGVLGRLAARLARTPAVVHTPHGHIFYGYYGRAWTALFVALERVAAPLTDRIIVLTEREMEEHLERRIGRREQFRVIPSGVDLEAVRALAPPAEEARRRLGVEADCLLLVGVGRLVPVKGFDLLLRALPAILNALPAARLLLVGDGPVRLSLEAQARALGVADRVALVGARAQVAPFLAAADLLVMPSRNEGLGKALVEAMALGRAVVATRVGGIPSVVVDGETGSLVSPDDPAALARAVTELLKDPGLRHRMGDAGRRRAEQFSLAVMESRLLDLYRELCAQKGLQWPAAT
jgi:glycosyltransferase involved in cell wall biosynthesis